MNLRNRRALYLSIILCLTVVLSACGSTCRNSRNVSRSKEDACGTGSDSNWLSPMSLIWYRCTVLTSVGVIFPRILATGTIAGFLFKKAAMSLWVGGTSLFCISWSWAL